LLRDGLKREPKKLTHYYNALSFVQVKHPFSALIADVYFILTSLAIFITNMITETGLQKQYKKTVLFNMRWSTLYYQAILFFSHVLIMLYIRLQCSSCGRLYACARQLSDSLIKVNFSFAGQFQTS
jgi:hypothetical protein